MKPEKLKADNNRKEMKDNLLAVIEMLHHVPDEQFNMEHWWLDNGMAFDDDRNIMYKVANGPCGCAIGHLIQRGLISGEVLKSKDLPHDALPYQHSDRIYVQIADALKIYNYKIAEFMFSQYGYMGNQRPIQRQDVIRRIEFVISELDYFV